MLLVVWALGFLSISPCGVVKVPSSNYMVFVYRSRHEETGLCVACLPQWVLHCVLK